MAKIKVKCPKKRGVMNSKFDELLRPKQAWLVAYVLVAVAELVFIAAHASSRAALVATWVLAPLLAIWVWKSHGPKLLVLALGVCWLGDVLGNPRAIGIGQVGVVPSAAAFAAAGVFLVVLFIRRGVLGTFRGSSDTRRGWRAGAAAVYLAAAIIGVLFAWSGLSIVLRIAVSIYLLLFAALATSAASAGIVTAIGTALFFGSEILAALEVAGRLHGAAMAFRLTFNTLYLLGILLIAVGTVTLDHTPGRDSTVEPITPDTMTR